MTNKPEIDEYELNRLLDRTKTHVFMGKNAAFLGSLMCGMNFVWTDTIPTAAVSTDTFYWNPEWFLSLDPETRKTVLMHELWHIALLHVIRVDARDPLIWNYATDIVINNMLENEGYSFKGIEACWKDQSYGSQNAEPIYDDLYAKNIKPPQSSWGNPPKPCNGGQGPGSPSNKPGDVSGPGTAPNLPGNGAGDMVVPTADDMARAVNRVVQAAHSARLAGQPGSIPGEVEIIINKFLAPVIPWELHLKQFFEDMIQGDWSWAKPNRRYPDMYLPSPTTEEGKLAHLMYFQDVSGSISDEDNVRFNSEVKYIKETYNPEKLTLVQFDTRITQVREFTDMDPFEEIIIEGRGGTCLIPVRDYIIKHRPTAAIIFSDLQVTPMEPLPFELPVIWVAIDNRSATVPFGKLIHIKG